MATPVPSVRDDQRGAILVPALVMGALLTGALFYVAGVGDAIMFRTELQNAADSTSFTGAVWHARGMNIIAVLNILMSGVLAVFALLRIAEIVCFVIGLIPIIGAPVETAAVELVAQERTIAPWIDRGLKVLSGAEDGVSLAVPYVALADAKIGHTAASTVMPFSMSLLPPAVDRALGKEPRRPEQLTAALPIQEDTFGMLCGKAVAFVPNQLTALIDRLPLPGFGKGIFKRAVGGVVNALVDEVVPKVFATGDGIFCQPLTGLLTTLINNNSSRSCDEARSADDEARSDRQSQRDEATRDGGTLSTEQQDQQDADRSAKPVDCSKGNDKTKDPLGDGAGVQFSSKPSKMWEMAGNGNVFMHSWSWVRGEPQLFAWGQEGLGIADRGRAPSVVPSPGANAMAEYYFDCDKTWGDAACEPKATWSPNWTARMRRFRSPAEGLMVIAVDTPLGWLDTAQQSIGDHVGDITTEVLERLTGIHQRDAVSEWVSAQVEKIPFVSQLSDKIDSSVGGLRASTGIDDLLNPRNLSDERRIH